MERTLTAAERDEKIDGLIQRWRSGEFSEVVFTASLIAAGKRKHEVDDLTAQHRAAFRESLPFLRGDVR